MSGFDFKEYFRLLDKYLAFWNHKKAVELAREKCSEDIAWPDTLTAKFDKHDIDLSTFRKKEEDERGRN